MAKKPVKRGTVVAARLENVRLRRGWTQEKLAQKSGVARKTVSNAEQLKPLYASTVERFAEALEVPYEALLGLELMAVDASNRDVREWHIAEFGKVETATNGLQWRVCELHHKLVAGRKDRGKLYDLLAFVPGRLRDELRESLTRHAQVCDRVGNHPNVARNRGVFAAEKQDYWWVIDEWIDGFTLTEALSNNESLIPQSIPKLMRAVASGLAALHKADIIRRELSPRFIIVNDDRAVLTDFELAKLLDGSPTVNVGDWPDDVYRAPEVQASKKLDKNCDLFSWAMILAHCLARRKPDNPDDSATIVAESELPKKVKTTVLNCLAPSARRPRDASKLVSALAKWS